MVETMTDTSETFDFQAEMYRLPDRLRASMNGGDSYYEDLHAEFVKKLLNDATGLTMNTIQIALVERIANGYVLMRWHEDNPNNWIGVNTEKDFTMNWRALVAEFNKVLATGQDKHWAEMKKTYRKILVDGLLLVENVEARKKLREHYIQAFSDIGE